MGDKWYRTKEYYYDSRKEGAQRTDEEHYKALKELVNGKKISAVAVDPSAASFIQVIKRHGEFNVVKANNQVVDGIRRVSALLKDKRLIICNTCTSAIHEFGLYRWQEGSSDAPIKENDHAMDDIRYFATTIYEDDDGFIAVAAKPREAIYENF